MASLSVLAPLIITSNIIIKLTSSTTCPYVANYQYTSNSGLTTNTLYVADIIDGECNSRRGDTIENGITYGSNRLFCENNTVFLDFFVGTECAGSPGVTKAVTAINESGAPAFSYSCNDSVECTDYFQFSPSNSSQNNYDRSNPPTECVEPDTDDFVDTLKFLSNLCIPLRDGSNEIWTCNSTGAYLWYHESSNCSDNEPELAVIIPTEGCLINPATPDQFGVYYKVIYCGDAMTMNPTISPSVNTDSMDNGDDALYSGQVLMVWMMTVYMVWVLW